MAQVALPSTSSSDATSAERKTHVLSPLVEFLLVGGATPLFFVLSFALRRTLGLDSAEYVAGLSTFLAAFVINDPHFAVTYLLFYRDAKDKLFGRSLVSAQRARYFAAGVVAPTVLGAFLVMALIKRSAPWLGFAIQLMFLLVGWHYVKQGFGVMLTLAGRRGLRFSPGERAVILAHCLAGWAYAWASPFDPGRVFEEKGVVYKSIAHPVGLEALSRAAAVATFALLVLMLLRKGRREGARRLLALTTPLVALLASVWTWSVWSGIDPIARYYWPALHSVQYLTFVWLLRRNEAAAREGPPWFEAKTSARLALLAAGALALGFVLFHAAPAILDGALVAKRERASTMGPTPYFAALYVFVNVHHYVMDAVLWRRDNPETAYLLR